MSDASSGSRHGPGRRFAGRAQDDRRIDPYHAAAKPEGAARSAPTAGPPFTPAAGSWGAGLGDIHNELCPACRRIRDD